MTNLTRTARREISRRKSWYVYITPQQPKPADMRQGDAIPTGAKAKVLEIVNTDTVKVVSI